MVASRPTNKKQGKQAEIDSDPLQPRFIPRENAWRTPLNIFKQLHDEFDFELDACADPNWLLCPINITNDSLNQRWFGRVWCNPPYGTQIRGWIEKAYQESQQDYNELIVLLVPNSTGSRWFHDWVYNKAEVRFWKGRIRFVGANDRAPFDSIVIIYQKDTGTSD